MHQRPHAWSVKHTNTPMAIPTVPRMQPTPPVNAQVLLVQKLLLLINFSSLGIRTTTTRSALWQPSSKPRTVRTVPNLPVPTQGQPTVYVLPVVRTNTALTGPLVRRTPLVATSWTPAQGSLEPLLPQPVCAMPVQTGPTPQLVPRPVLPVARTNSAAAVPLAKRTLPVQWEKGRHWTVPPAQTPNALHVELVSSLPWTISLLAKHTALVRQGRGS